MKARRIMSRLGAWWFRLGLLVILAVAAGALWTPYPAQLVRALRGHTEPKKQIVEKRVEVPVEVRVEVPVPVPADGGASAKIPQVWKPEDLVAPVNIQLPPFPPVLPEKLSTGTFEQYTALARGLHLRSTVNFSPGSTASRDRTKSQAYQIRLSMELLLPHAAEGQELLHANPELPKVLANYPALMEQAQVSPWFHALYLHKQNRVRRSLASLSQPLDKHNFYDTDTILRITAPGSKRRVLWMQADMDVVSDGSDGDRLSVMPEKIRNSDNYQPSTSYRWKKRSTKPNPLLPGWEVRLSRLLKEKPRRPDAIDNARRVIQDLKHFSYLLAQYDPFIVVPLTLKEGRDDDYRPELGDYAVVIVGNKAYPAIVGDYGPRYKTGEASLRLGKLVNSRAGVYARSVSNLSASYLIFPHTKEPENGPIDYERLNTRCRELLEEIGGLGPEGEFVEMEDLLAPKPPSKPSEEPEKDDAAPSTDAAEGGQAEQTDKDATPDEPAASENDKAAAPPPAAKPVRPDTSASPEKQRSTRKTGKTRKSRKAKERRR